MAEACGLLELSPSDLVCETNFQGISYYDFVLSSSITGNSALTGGATLYLCKFDTNTNLESMETVTVPSTVFTESGLPATDIALAVLGMLTFREQIARSKVLCLVRTVDQDCMNSLEVRLIGFYSKIVYDLPHLIPAMTSAKLLTVVFFLKRSKDCLVKCIDLFSCFLFVKPNQVRVFLNKNN